MDAKIGLIAIVAVLAGAVTGGVVAANFIPRTGSETTEATDTSALDAALEDAAYARAEADRWQREADRLADQLAVKPDESNVSTETPVDGALVEIEHTQAPMDAVMREELEAYRERDREREERYADQRGERDQWRTEMQDRRTNMFTELIERTEDPAEQQRWADIEKQMSQTRDLFQQMRDAETDEERYAVRGTLGEHFEHTESLLKEQQNAVLQRALKDQGITDSKQLSLIQDAVQNSLSDEAFQMSPSRGPGGRGPGGGGPGRGGPGRGGPGGGGGRGPGGR